MSVNSSSFSRIAFRIPLPSKAQRLRLKRRSRRRRRLLLKEAKKKTQMEINNLKLYLNNKRIIQQNQELRKKAFLLRQENQLLLSHLHNIYSNYPYPRLPHDTAMASATATTTTTTTTTTDSS